MSVRSEKKNIELTENEPFHHQPCHILNVCIFIYETKEYIVGVNM